MDLPSERNTVERALEYSCENEASAEHRDDIFEKLNEEAEESGNTESFAADDNSESVTGNDNSASIAEKTVADPEMQREEEKSEEKDEETTEIAVVSENPFNDFQHVQDYDEIEDYDGNYDDEEHIVSEFDNQAEQNNRVGDAASSSDQTTTNLFSVYKNMVFNKLDIGKEVTISRSTSTVTYVALSTMESPNIPHLERVSLAVFNFFCNAD